MERRDFLGVAAGLLGLAAAGCDSDSTSADAGTGGDAGGGGGSCAPDTMIGTNHGHVLTVEAADVAAGEDKTYAIQGSSGHPHSVTITAAQFSSLANGMSLTVESTTDAGHNHSITVTCA